MRIADQRIGSIDCSTKLPGADYEKEKKWEGHECAVKKKLIGIVSYETKQTKNKRKTNFIGVYRFLDIVPNGNEYSNAYPDESNKQIKNIVNNIEEHDKITTKLFLYSRQNLIEMKIDANICILQQHIGKSQTPTTELSMMLL